MSSPAAALRLRPAVEADIPAIVDTYFSAFQHGVICKICFAPTKESSHVWFGNFVLKEMKQPEARWLVVEDESLPLLLDEEERLETNGTNGTNDYGHTNGNGHPNGHTNGHDSGPGVARLASRARPHNSRVVAFAKWVAPRACGVPKTDEGADDLCPPEGDKEVAEDFFSSMHDSHCEIMGSEPHWFLSLIGTREQDQGKGAGGMLLRWGLERADKEAKRCFLDATEEGRPVYEKYGFQAIKVMHFVGDTHTQSCMTRGLRGY